MADNQQSSDGKTRREALQKIGVGGIAGATATSMISGTAAAEDGEVMVTEDDDDDVYKAEFSGPCPSNSTYSYVGHHTINVEYNGISGTSDGEWMHTLDICGTGWAGRYWPGFPQYEDPEDASEGLYIHGHALDFQAGDEDVYLPSASNDSDIIGIAPGDAEDADPLVEDNHARVKELAGVIIDNVEGVGYARDADDIVETMLRDDSGGSRDYIWDYGSDVYGTGRTQVDHFVEVRMFCDPGENANGEFQSEIDFYFKSGTGNFHTYTIDYTLPTPNGEPALAQSADTDTITIDGEEIEVGPTRENPGEVSMEGEIKD
ncbi:hypothetical protein GS429_21405 [Natronorubrum sp. JWXQ-INN-674]|uniref:Uncharacterized protein n=1 Tax=Natronorubrum halalkaliphilum TaxID=2691917 RepID=A0A6B0VTT6_9EURY|nr:hypothetical protein [Natronorubrum halalkaliphilum]MXV64583.1 hypothetical protein [Natronorubrum halalkaliphilum]